MAARHLAGYYCARYRLPYTEIDDITQEISIAEWRGKNTFCAVIDYIRRYTFSRVAYKAGARLWLESNLTSQRIPEREINIDYTDYIFLSRLTEYDVALAASLELGKPCHDSYLPNNGTNCTTSKECRLSQVKRTRKNAITKLYLAV